MPAYGILIENISKGGVIVNIKKITAYVCSLLLTLNFVGCANKSESLNITLTSSKVEPSKIIIDYKTFDVPRFTFIDNIIKDARIIEYKDFRIIKPLYMNLDKQSLTYNQIVEQFKKLPKVLTENVKEIQLLDYNSASDKYWSETYDTKDFKSFASGGDNRICFYANDHFSNSKNISKMLPTLIHEAGHLLDITISSKDKKFSSSTEWILIMDKDLNIKDNGYGLFCSKYSQDASSSIEDFAEAVMQYVMDKEKFIKEYPNRAEKLEELFNSKKLGEI